MQLEKTLHLQLLLDHMLWGKMLPCHKDAQVAHVVKLGKCTILEVGTPASVKPSSDGTPCPPLTSSSSETLSQDHQLKLLQNS